MVIKMSKFRLGFCLNNFYISQFVLNPTIVYLGVCFWLIVVGCTPQGSLNSQTQNNPFQKSELSSTPNSSIPNKREFEQQKSQVKGLLKESEQLEKEVDDFIGSKVPKGEELYKDISTGKCDWLIKRADFYENFAENLSEQARKMTPGYPPQGKTLELAKSARQRASSFQQEINKRCSVQ
jgi:hypothetical protein